MRRKTQIRQMPDKNETRGGIGQPSVHYTESILALAGKKVKQNSQNADKNSSVEDSAIRAMTIKRLPCAKGAFSNYTI